MSDSGARPVGWYADVSGTGTMRWWDGRSWAEQPGVVVQPRLPDGTTTNTWPVWVQAFTPLAGVVTNLLLNPGALLRNELAQQRAQLRQLRVEESTGHVRVAVVHVALFTPDVLVSWAVGSVLLAVVVLLSHRDWVLLRRRGIVQPFHWAWSFLMPTYPIGRAVVLHRRIGSGSLPLWIYLATTAVALAVSGVVLASAFTA